jgi:hypothetical protein
MFFDSRDALSYGHIKWGRRSYVSKHVRFGGSGHNLNLKHHTNHPRHYTVQWDFSSAFLLLQGTNHHESSAKFKQFCFQWRLLLPEQNGDDQQPDYSTGRQLLVSFTDHGSGWDLQRYTVFVSGFWKYYQYMWCQSSWGRATE